jgi:hypothetical protein
VRVIFGLREGGCGLCGVDLVGSQFMQLIILLMWRMIGVCDTAILNFIIRFFDPFLVCGVADM